MNGFRRRRGRVVGLVAGVVVVAVLGAVPTGAQASAGESGVVECEGTMTGEIVGDVVVQGTEVCVLERAVVTGDVIVTGNDDWAGGVELRRSAVRGDLVLLDVAQASLVSSTVKGDIRTEGFYVTLSMGRSSVYGGVYVNSPFSQVFIGNSTIRRSLRGVGLDVVLSRVKIEGALTLRGGRAGDFDEGDMVRLSRSEVGGWVTTRMMNTFVHGSTLHKGLSLFGDARTEVCGSSVTGDLTVSGSTPDWYRSGESYGHSRLGVESYQPCARSMEGDGVPVDVVVGGATRIINNAVPVTIGRLTTGTLECRGNIEPFVVGPEVVAPERSGQCA